MAIMTFATIEIASYSVTLEIYEMSPKNGINSLDRVTHRIELGKASYATGKIPAQLVEELCEVISDFTDIMGGYRIDDYRAFATSAIREASNAPIVLSNIFQKTGIRVVVLSNSEQRFLSYKGIASKGSGILKIIEQSTAIIDVSGGSIQISLFDNDSLITTQNVKLGSLRIRERLSQLEHATPHYEVLVEEMIRNEIVNFKKLHLKDRKIVNVILVGNNFTDSILYNKKPDSNHMITRQEYMEWYQMVISHSPSELAVRLGIPLEYASLMIPTAIINKRLIDEMDAETIWTPGGSLSDGFCYDYAVKNKCMKVVHNFDKDIVLAAQNIGKRYTVAKAHTLMMDKMAKTILNATRKIHGLSERARLLLQVAICVHDCGKYISLVHVGECSFNIIISTEIIGLSHLEREIIAHVVKYNTVRFGDFKEVNQNGTLRMDDYVLIAKLTALLRLVNALDRSHMQKVDAIKATVRERELILTVETKWDYSLETALVEEKADFFEEVYNIRPVIKIRKKV